MKNTLLKKTAFVITCLFTSIASAQITLDSLSASEYVEKLIGTGITYSNVSLVGSPNAIRYFENGTSGGLSPYLESGIVLSTGVLVADSLNAPSSSLISSSLATPGFTELSTIAGVPTNDGIMLQFDFVPTNESLNIKFQFGSEEYDEWVNTMFNDVFAFFISGPGIDGEKNIALVPFTEDRIAINSINSGQGPVCPPNILSATNPMFHINNCEGIYDNCMDGFTTQLTAFSEVIPNETYTIKLMLADGSDTILDSWVFLQEAGISSEEMPPVPDNLYTENIPTSHYSGEFQEDVTGYSTNSTQNNSECSEAILSIEVPEGFQIANLKVEYTIISYNGALATDQRSMLYSPTLNLGEETIVEGSYNYPGEEKYNRDITFANGATGTVDFVLKAWRAFGDEGCNADYSYVMENSWSITPEYEPLSSNNDFEVYNFSYYPNPVNGLLFLNSNTEITEVSVFNLIGQKLNVPTFAQNTQIDLSGLYHGNYLVHVKINESIKVFKIVRQ